MKYVIDATMGVRDGLFCFCPVELNDDGEIDTILTGLTYLSSTAPGEMIAVFHEDGSDAVEQFCEQYQAEIAALRTTPQTKETGDAE